MGNGTILVVLAIALAACGGANDAPADTAASGTSATTTSTNAANTTAARDTTDAATDGRDVVEDPPTLDGTSWNVTELTAAEWGFTNVWDYTTVTLEFGEDGSLSGSTGCNDLSGTWAVEGPFYAKDQFSGERGGQVLTIEAVAGTGGECDDDAMEQEADILSNLADTGWFNVFDDLGLVLYDDDIEVLINAEPIG